MASRMTITGFILGVTLPLYACFHDGDSSTGSRPQTKPVASISAPLGDDITPSFGQFVELQGHSASGSDNAELKFNWRQISGSQVALHHNIRGDRVAFHVPETTRPVVVELILDNGGLLSEPTTYAIRGENYQSNKVPGPFHLSLPMDAPLVARGDTLYAWSKDYGLAIIDAGRHDRPRLERFVAPTLPDDGATQESIATTLRVTGNLLWLLGSETLLFDITTPRQPELRARIPVSAHSGVEHRDHWLLAAAGKLLFYDKHNPTAQQPVASFDAGELKEVLSCAGVLFATYAHYIIHYEYHPSVGLESKHVYQVPAADGGNDFRLLNDMECADHGLLLAYQSGEFDHLPFGENFGQADELYDLGAGDIPLHLSRNEQYAVVSRRHTYAIPLAQLNEPSPPLRLSEEPDLIVTSKFLASGRNNLISLLPWPEQSQWHDLDRPMTQLVAHEDFLYLQDDSGWFELDARDFPKNELKALSNPPAIPLLANGSTAGGVHGMINLFNLASPYPFTEQNSKKYIHAVRQQHFGVFATADTLEVVDFTKPREDALQATLSLQERLGEKRRLSSVAWAGDFLYALAPKDQEESRPSALFVFDVSQPAKPEFRKRIDMPGESPMKIWSDGTRIFILNGRYLVEHTPDGNGAPQRKARVPTTALSILHHNNKKAFAGDGDEPIDIVDLQSDEPRVIGRLLNTTPATRIDSDHDSLYRLVKNELIRIKRHDASLQQRYQSAGVNEVLDYHLSWRSATPHAPRCVTTGGECVLDTFDETAKSATFQWRLPAQAGDEEIRFYFGDAAYFEFSQDEVTVQ